MKNSCGMNVPKSSVKNRFGARVEAALFCSLGKTSAPTSSTACTREHETLLLETVFLQVWLFQGSQHQPPYEHRNSLLTSPDANVISFFHRKS